METTFVCTLDQANILTGNSGRKATVNGRDAAVSCNDWHEIIPPHLRLTIAYDYRNADVVKQRVTDECQELLDRLHPFDSAVEAHEYVKILKSLDNNAKLALDEIGFGEPEGNLRHRACPFHPDRPEHQLSIIQDHLNTRVACAVEDLPYSGLDIFAAINGIQDRPTAATKLLNRLIEEYGRDRLNLSALDGVT